MVDVTTLRIARRKRFTIIDRELINDNRLSWKARGILVWLLDKPDNWETNADAIANAGLDGRSAVLAGLKELEDCNYIVRTKERDTMGHVRTVTTVYESPGHTGSRLSDVGLSDVGLSDVGKPTPLIKTERPKTDETKTENEESASADAPPNKKGIALKEDHWRLANLLADLIEANGSKRPAVNEAQVQAIEKLERIDGRSLDGIEKVIRWCQHDEFWHRNVLSCGALRKHYDRLRLDAQKPARRKTNISSTGEGPAAFDHLQQMFDEAQAEEGG